MNVPTATATWKSLEADRDSLRSRNVRELFATDSSRYDLLSRRWNDWLVDFSKQRLDPCALDHLLQLAREMAMEEGIAAMAAGQSINGSEGRAALHIALRAREPYSVAGKDVSAEVASTRERIRTISGAVRDGVWLGATGKRIRHVVNIGIGGSDLGPRMAATALGRADDHVRVSFVANIDPFEMRAVMSVSNPEETLFIVSSKTFTTIETLTNAKTARDWLVGALGADADIGRHMLAVSNNVAAASEFGIPAAHCLPMAEWVGGRYSMWSAIGLPLACRIGWQDFETMLDGARDMDQHFLHAPLQENLPVLLALIDIWNTALWGAQTRAVLPYCQALRDLPAYLQQLEMESNGKRVSREASPLDSATSAVVWGGVGTTGQHAFHQLMYQGTLMTPADFIVPVGDNDPAQTILVANALAQSAALMQGRSLESAREWLLAQGRSAEQAEVNAPHLVCPGNQPSTTIMFPRLSPRALGSLVALYEHKTFAAGWILGINSFDQWGVELGKQMAREILPRMLDSQGDFDPSTQGLLAHMRAHRHA